MMDILGLYAMTGALLFGYFILLGLLFLLGEKIDRMNEFLKKRQLYYAFLKWRDRE